MHTDLEVFVKSVTWEAPSVLSWELRLPGGGLLPPFQAGAHVDMRLDNGMVRSYSLVNSGSERDRYVVAVKREEGGRGGSRYLHEHVRPGHRIRASAPRNHFPLEENATNTVFFAGGIGITPILAMARRLAELGKPWTLYYCTRRPEHAPFVAELQGLRAPDRRLELVFDEVAGCKPLDIAGSVRSAPPESHLYCCGPASMIAAFESAGAGWPAGQIHVERFTAQEEPATEGGFVVSLAKSGLEVYVPQGRSILDALLDAGIDVPHACTEGVCGTCELPVLEGAPDHRDVVLSKAERERSATMMVCCSGSLSARLVLDA